MKEVLGAYYRPSKDEFAELWATCLFVVDANVLLNLYRYAAKARGEPFRIFEEIEDRLWVPHQAVLEYQ